MITLVTGPPGAGKSFYALRKLVDALESGKVIATNVQLRDGWAEKVSRRHPIRRVLPPLQRARAEAFDRAAFFSQDLSELFRVRLRGSGEGRGVMVLDEAHNWLNARAWDSDPGDKTLARADAVARRLEVVRFFSQHRKLGWDVYLIAQQADLLDKQVRSLFEYHVQLRNLRKMKVGGLPVSPVNLFLAVWTWHSAQRVVVRRELFGLNGTRKLYDTFATSHGLDEDGGDATVIWLPRSAETG